MPLLNRNINESWENSSEREIHKLIIKAPMPLRCAAADCTKYWILHYLLKYVKK